MPVSAGENSSERLSDQAFEILHRAITRCELAPGEIISEPQIEQRFGLGRVGIRLAMDRLIQLQLVKPIHRRGFEIAPIRVADVRNTFELRLLIEPPAVRMSADRGPDIGQLRRINQRTLAKAKSGDRSVETIVIDANREFHLLMIQGCRNEKIMSLMRQILNDIDRVYYFGLMRHPEFGVMQEQHGLMIDALEEGDAGKAERLAREHIETGYQIVIDAIMQNASFEGASAQPPRKQSSSVRGPRLLT